jgi:anti-sigma B factor antagonist
VLLGIVVPTVVVLDLTGVTFLGSAGLTILIEAVEFAGATGRPLRVVAATPRVLRPMQIAGLHSVFEFYPSVHDALAGAGQHRQ